MSLDYNDRGLHVANIELIARLFLRKATWEGIWKTIPNYCAFQ